MDTDELMKLADQMDTDSFMKLLDDLEAKGDDASILIRQQLIMKSVELFFDKNLNRSLSMYQEKQAGYIGTYYSVDTHRCRKPKQQCGNIECSRTICPECWKEHSLNDYKICQDCFNFYE